MVLLTVTDGDARPYGRHRQDLAREYAGKLRTVLHKAHKELSLETLLMEGALAVAATAVLAAILLTFHKVFPKIHHRIKRWEGSYIKAVKIQRVEVFSAETLTRQVIAVANGVRFALTIVIVYVYLTTVLGLFPWTRQLATKLVQAVVATLTTIAQAFLSALPDFAAIIVIIMVTRYVIKLIQMVFNGIQRGAITFAGFHRDWATRRSRSSASSSSRLQPSPYFHTSPDPNRKPSAASRSSSESCSPWARQAPSAMQSPALSSPTCVPSNSEIASK